MSTNNNPDDTTLYYPSAEKRRKMGDIPFSTTVNLSRKMKGEEDQIIATNTPAVIINDDAGLFEEKARSEEQEQEQEKEDVVSLPIMILLNSHFFIGSGLSIINKEASNHTRILTAQSNILKIFLRRSIRCQAFYDGTPELRGGGGPNSIGWHPFHNSRSTDVLAVSIDVSGTFHLLFRDTKKLCIGANPADVQRMNSVNRSLESVASHITSWWEQSKEKTNGRLSFDKASLPSGSIVDFSPDTYDDDREKEKEDPPDGEGAVMHLRHCVLYSYLLYHSLWKGLVAPFDNMLCVGMTIFTSEDYDKYGDPEEEEICMSVHRTALGFATCTLTNLFSFSEESRRSNLFYRVLDQYPQYYSVFPREIKPLLKRKYAHLFKNRKTNQHGDNKQKEEVNRISS